MADRALLIVDDESRVLNAISRAVRPLNLKLLVALSAQEAATVMASHPISVMISDYRMPGTDGIQLLRYNKTTYPDIVNILLTGNGDYELAVAAINEGLAFKFLEKPWNDHELIDDVRDAFERFRIEQLNRDLQNQLVTRNRELEELASGLESTVRNLKEELSLASTDMTQYRQLAEVANSTAQIMHDLKNPLTIFSVSMSLLKGSAPSEGQVRAVNMLDNAFNSVMEMVTSVPRYTKQIAEDIQLAPTYLDSFLTDIALPMASVIEAKGLRFDLDLRSAAEIELDQPKMSRAVQNLLKNAVEATAEGYVKLASGTNETSVEITIEDSGTGIPPQIQDKLFTPFTTFGKKGGTGLGLSGAKSVVQRHGGSIDAENLEPGARFTIKLPRQTKSS